MTRDQAQVGAHVRSLRNFFGVPLGTEGRIVEDYRTGITVEWQGLPNAGSLNPLRDGFDKATELGFLELVTPAEKTTIDETLAMGRIARQLAAYKIPPDQLAFYPVVIRGLDGDYTVGAAHVDQTLGRVILDLGKKLG